MSLLSIHRRSESDRSDSFIYSAYKERECGGEARRRKTGDARVRTVKLEVCVEQMKFVLSL